MNLHQMQQRLAKAYKTGDSCTPRKQALATLHTLIGLEFINVACSGIQLQYVKGQPYSDFEDAKHEVQNTNILRISTDHNDSIILDSSTNLKFRVVHDWHHLILNAPFTMAGEFRTAQYFMSLTPTLEVKQILFSEIALQAAYALEYGKFAPIQKLVYIA
jgi:hypothetical protein